MPDPLSAWLHSPKKNSHLPPPDGRPLYRYRLDDEAFQSLKDVLRQHLRPHSSLDPPNTLSSSFPALFVLFASEWWRRCYDGSGWTWQAILADLEADRKHWMPVHRSACVEQGLRAWKLERTQAGGLRYLRAIALQGGLPLHLLKEARGGIGRVLKRVLTLAKVGAPEPGLIRGWIESLHHELPKNYREEAIYDLLTDVICTVLAVVREARITETANVVQRLDEGCPGWRDRFSLPVSDIQAQGLVEQLVRDAAIEPAPARLDLVVERWLEPTDHDTDWRLCSSLAIPDRLEGQAIQGIFAPGSTDSPESLPRTLVIRLEAKDLSLDWAARRLAGQQGTYRIERQTATIDAEAASRDHVIRLLLPDGRVCSATPRRGEVLDADLPWIFEEGADGTPRWFRQGSGGIRSAQGVLALPLGWDMQMDESAHVEPIGQIQTPARRLYRFRGTAIITAPDGTSWRVRAGQAQSNEQDFHWIGQRSWDGFVDPPLAFLGRPRLHDGTRSIPSQDLIWQPASNLFGPCIVTYREHGTPVHRARMVILPPEAHVRFVARDVQGGEIHLIGWNIAQVSTAASDVSYEVVQKPNALILRLHWHNPNDAHVLPPEWIELTLTWLNNPRMARLRVPFPARGVHAFDAEGLELTPDSWCPVHRLLGARLIAICVGHRLDLRLRLRHTAHEGPPIQSRLPIRAQPGMARIEIRLHDYIDEIERLFAADELLDAWVEASLCAGPATLFKLRISRYVCPLERGETRISLPVEGLTRITPERLARLSVHAMRLEAPGEESLRLEPCCSEAVPTGSWFFEPSRREPGSWLIYPGLDAPERFRPTLWNVEGEVMVTGSLTQALNIGERDKRTQALDTVIARLAEDYGAPGWNELEQLAGHLGHLPLVSFDLWRRLVHSPEAMVALALRLHTELTDEFIAKFARELPFVWELIPFQTWCRGTERLQRQCVAWFGGPILWRRQLERRLEHIECEFGSRHPGLAKLLGLVRCFCLSKDCPEVRLMASPSSLPLFDGQLFDGPESSLQQLLRGHPDDDWPAADETLTRWIQTYRSKSPQMDGLFPRQSLGFKNAVISTPILLAIQVATGTTGVWFEHPRNIHRLRCFRAFDPDWFDTAFDLTIARCLATGLLRPPTA